MSRFKIQVGFRHFYSFVSQVIFWAVSYFVLLNVFTDSHSPEPIDYLYTLIFMITLVMSVVIHFKWIVFRFLDHQRYGLFFVGSLANMLTLALFNQILFNNLIDHILPGYYFISYYAYIDLVKFFFIFISLTTLLHLSWEWWQLQETRHRMAVLEKEKIGAELRALTNQVNPHFLFNSLTVLYSLSLRSASETSEAIIKLSDILRYVIYDSARALVPLGEEIKMIRSYIDLQRFRVDPLVSIRFDEATEDDSATVSPMLFLPLVENSFKHGLHGKENDFIDIKLRSDKHQIQFLIRNSKSSEDISDKSSAGIGIKNIEQRLKLIYGDRSELVIRNEQDVFSVALNIQLNT